MLYNEGVTYNEPYFRYDGVRVVEPQSFGPTSLITDIKILKVVLLSPETIGSKLVFEDPARVIVSTGQESVTESTGYISIETYESGYIVFNVEDEDAFAVASAETIYLQDNSAGTVDVTILQTA